MICYLVRHGKDDETVRGGWSEQPLTEEGIQQVKMLAQNFKRNAEKLIIKQVYSSDLKRALQTAQILAETMEVPLTCVPGFREVNNGELAGMKNSLALERYPGLFWNQLEWEQSYPNGESPKQFYERICAAWEAFSQRILSHNENVVLVTHSGVMHVILSLIHMKEYKNTLPQRKIPHTGLIELQYKNGRWEEMV